MRNLLLARWRARGIATGAALLLVGSCRSRADKERARADDTTSAPSLPPLVVRDDATGLTFSYITLEGGFQKVTRVADVPYEARDVVRVWSDVSGDGIVGPFVYVADLRMPTGNGTYKVEVMPRTRFDDLAEERRVKGKAPPGPVASADVARPAGTDTAHADAHAVIIYGAEWCQPCHSAERYLKGKGIPFVHKDIEDPSVAEELASKLDAHGIHSDSIPVIDIGGRLLIGFDPGEIDGALAAARL